MLHAPLEASHFETKEWISQIEYRTYATIKRREWSKAVWSAFLNKKILANATATKRSESIDLNYKQYGNKNRYPQQRDRPMPFGNGNEVSRTIQVFGRKPGFAFKSAYGINFRRGPEKLFGIVAIPDGYL